MKKYLMIISCAAALLSFASCQKAETGDIKVVYYPVVTLEGGNVVTTVKGEAFVDPGFTATLNGEDISADVEIESNIDTDTYGIYSVQYNYSYTTEDGYFASSSASRTVVVCDEGTDAMSGTYTTTANAQRSDNGTAYPGYTCTLTYLGGNAYYVSDFLAGWYEQRAGYGSAYAMYGYALLNPDNTITAIYNHVDGWGDAADYIENGVYDPATGTVNWELSYAGSLKFSVEMTK